MKLYILSDIHAEFEPFNPPVVDADVVILAGDIHVGNKGIAWARERFGHIPVIYVLGNHEFYGEALPKHIDKLKEQTQGTNIHILENESLHIQGIQFLGCTLWTNFNLFGNPGIAGHIAALEMTDYKRIRLSPSFRKLRPADTTGFHHKSLHWLKESMKKPAGEKRVIVTHHAPSKLSIPHAHGEDMVSAAYASDLDAFVAESGALLWIHGHVHTQTDYNIGNTRVVCNPRGYPDEPNNDFLRDFVVHI